MKQVSDTIIKEMEHSANRTGCDWNAVFTARDNIGSWPQASVIRQRQWRMAILELSESAWREKFEQIANPVLRAKVASIVWWRHFSDMPANLGSAYFRSLLSRWPLAGASLGRRRVARELEKLGWPASMAAYDARHDSADVEADEQA